MPKCELPNTPIPREITRLKELVWTQYLPRAQADNIEFACRIDWLRGSNNLRYPGIQVVLEGPTENSGKIDELEGDIRSTLTNQKKFFESVWERKTMPVQDDKPEIDLRKGDFLYQYI